ncbi:hypothetical protein T02_6247 [Trichinella nativa]|uniref:Uncharacterized protein n=1 Tax=Trichinella nativa TaxID=6335 RepID=A0A0V1LCV1_9BILA|nr:hypothetical protein T02_6247 [Trichinella nativa]
MKGTSYTKEAIIVVHVRKKVSRNGTIFQEIVHLPLKKNRLLPRCNFQYGRGSLESIIVCKRIQLLNENVLILSIGLM